MQQLSGVRFVTLRSVWAEYQLTGRLKESTKKGYQKAITAGLADWLDTPVVEISKDGVQLRHRELTERGPALANQVMRVLKALLNFAKARFELSTFMNPVARLSEVRAWNKVKKRKSMVQPSQMADFYRSILSLSNTVARDYFLLLLFTGVRKMEGARLRWTDIDFAGGTILVRDTKNGEDYTVPMSTFLHEMLSDRHRRRKNQKHPGEYVFQGRMAGTHISDWRASQAQLIKRSGVKFKIHDLRRTFITTGDSLDIQKHVLKALVNHSSGDVTDDYIIPSIARLRKPMQLITDEILRQAGVVYNKASSIPIDQPKTDPE